MKPKVVAADVVDGGVMIGFSDGSNVLFKSEYLYDNQQSDSNEPLPSEKEFEL